MQNQLKKLLENHFPCVPPEKCFEQLRTFSGATCTHTLAEFAQKHNCSCHIYSIEWFNLSEKYSVICCCFFSANLYEIPILVFVYFFIDKILLHVFFFFFCLFVFLDERFYSKYA